MSESDPIRLRASSLAELLDCALRWQKKHLDGMRLPSTPPAMIGTAVHASTAVFDQARLEGDPVSITDSAQVAVESIQHPDEEVDWMGVRQEKALATALNVHERYCEEVAPHYEYVVVEHTLTPLVVTMENGVTFELTGTLDRIIQDNEGRRGIGDVKTGANAVRADGTVIVGKHAPQLGEYTLLAEQTFGLMELPSVIIGLHTGGAGRTGVGEVHGAVEALVGTVTEPGLLDYVSQYFESGLFPPNPGSWLCSERYCPFYSRCKFHG